MKQWQKIKLCDALIINPIEKLPKGIMAKKISMEKLLPFHRDILEYEYSKFSGGSKFRNNDTIMARITPCLENGKRAKVGVLNKNEIGFGSTEFIVFRKKENISDADFIYYLICSDQIRIPAIKSMVGSSGRQRVQIDVLKELIINLPPLDIQKKIAGVLGALDDKIELNNRINNNLEQQMYALVEQDILNIETKIFLDEFCNVFTGRKNANEFEKNGVNKFFTCGPDALTINSFIYDGSAIIVSGNGAYTGRTRFYKGKFDLYQRTYACTIKENIKSDYIYILYPILKLQLEKKLMGGTHGSAIPYIVMNDIAKFQVPFNEPVFNKIAPICKAIIDKIQANEAENEKLSQLRDTLLPKLMSGEVDVSKVDISALTSTDKLSFNEGE